MTRRGAPVPEQQPLDGRQVGEIFLPIHRSNQSLDDDREYIDSGIEQVLEIEAIAGDLAAVDVLDFGCGQGRLANALIAADRRPASYHGVDTNARSIAWCQEFISDRVAPEFRFTHTPAHNERYNRRAVGRPELPFDDASFDVVFLNSVFSHMRSDDVGFYASEFARVLRPTGFAYITAFVEDDVPDEDENPAGYLEDWGASTGPLHRVRFERRYLMQLLAASGLPVEEIRHRAIARTQQSIVIARPAARGAG